METLRFSHGVQNDGSCFVAVPVGEVMRCIAPSVDHMNLRSGLQKDTDTNPLACFGREMERRAAKRIPSMDGCTHPEQASQNLK